MAAGTTGGRTAAGRGAHPTAHSANVATSNQRTPLATLCALFVVLTLRIGLLIAWLPFLLLGLWFIDRIVRGWPALRDGQPVYE
jgi:uncharacterized membrane protein